MIIQTGSRTDIPAFYAEWFMKRIKAGFVDVRNPYYPEQVTRYRLDPEVVDLLGFCTKNPEPMLKYIDELKEFGQYWFVTITPYGKDIEPNIKDKRKVIEAFKVLSTKVGINRIAWRYDPIFINERYTLERHLIYFDKMCAMLSGYTQVCVISFIDLYKKVQKNFPEAREVTREQMHTIGEQFVKIGKKYGISIKTCAEGKELAIYGVDVSGCSTIATFEKALGCRLNVPKEGSARPLCGCYLSHDIGSYDSCLHGCRYCYANNSVDAVKKNYTLHDVNSSLLIGQLSDKDVIKQAKQISFKEKQLSLF